ncbi:MAG: methylated-DNA--[protein]-cysteine S-methyltransferase [bacterium]|uniref:methylated-DNA--[protein]-cysteine S-methyltransferase n=1 Tax=Candidatus Methylomirabilis tolerans TaxID=3123416 RepID=A0AAJ1AJQ3_9BACT|nr:methylated-DNA--[protein]-cysteine S-methyltransferase [Candidatus Methylomirabilis sp.]
MPGIKASCTESLTVHCLPRTPHPLRYARVLTPIGRLYVAHCGKVICCVTLGSDGRRFEQACTKTFGVRPIRDPRLPEEMAKQILDHLAGRRRFSGRIDLSRLTPFQQRVLRKVRTIPVGEVRSYRWVAQAIGSERAARAVGTALAENPVPLLIPCHRVVRSDGRLGEYSGGGPSVKATLLAFEGVDLDGVIGLRSRRKITIVRRRKAGADRPVSAA